MLHRILLDGLPKRKHWRSLIDERTLDRLSLYLVQNETYMPILF